MRHGSFFYRKLSKKEVNFPTLFSWKTFLSQRGKEVLLGELYLLNRGDQTSRLRMYLTPHVG